MKKLLSILLSTIFAFAFTACTNAPPPCAHVYGEWIVTTSPTLEFDGVETRYCNSCRNPETRSINKLYVLNATASNGCGVVSGDIGNFSWGDEVTVTASPYNGCSFTGWYNGNEKVCDQTDYTFIMPKQNVDLIATFEQFSFNFSVYVNDTELGTVTAPKQAVKGDQVTVTATPTGENIFDGWYYNNELLSNQKTYTFEMPADDYSLRANFSIPKWDGSVASAFAGGNGSLTNPYRISNGKELAYLATLLANETTSQAYYDCAYALTSNIDLNAKEWLPIGVYDNGESTSSDYLAFKGTFFGQGYTVKNFKVTTLAKAYYKNFGLFGCIKGTVKNLHVENAEINVETSADTRAGLLAGRAERATVVNCSVKGKVNVTVSQQIRFAYAGGLIGTIKNMGLDKCCAEVDVTATSVLGATESGGIVANVSKDVGSSAIYTISNVYVKGNVEANSQSAFPSYAGGILGSGANVCYAYHVGKVTAKAGADAYVYCGGISGRSSKVEYVYNDGNVYVETERARPLVNLVLGDSRDQEQNYTFGEGTRYRNGEIYTYRDDLDETNVSGPTSATRRTFFTEKLKFDETIWQCYYVDLPSKDYPTIKFPEKEIFKSY